MGLLDLIYIVRTCILGHIFCSTIFIMSICGESATLYIKSTIMGGGLFIRNLDDVHGRLWNKAPYMREIHKEKEMYTY